MKHTISNGDDVIDSRDVIERIAELRDERDAYEPGEGQAATWAEEFDEDATELAALEALAEEAAGYSEDWTHGAALIRDSYFEDYAQELAEDIGAIKGGESWPLNCIDWERAARKLQQDYTSVEFDGVTYWVR